MLDFRVLGPLEVWRDGELMRIAAQKQRALLALLLLDANRPIPRDELIDQLWGDEAPASVRASLQNQVHALRKLLGPTRLHREPAGYVLRVEHGELDLDRFKRLVAEARRGEPTERAARLRAALACWRGPALADLRSDPVGQHQIHGLEEQRLAALEDRIDADLELGRHADVVPELEALVGLHPIRERLWAHLMLALYRSGRQADALGAYRRAHLAFADELAIEPGVVLRELQRAMLVQDPALDDGEHRIGSTLERAAAILPMEAGERAESLYEYGLALLRVGEPRRALSTLESAERLAAAVDEPGVEERARLYHAYLRIWVDGASPLEHLARAERAAGRFEERGDDRGLWLAQRQQAQMLFESGRAGEALEVGHRCIDIAERVGSRWDQMLSRVTVAHVLLDGPTRVDDAVSWCEHELSFAGADDRYRFSLWVVLTTLHAQAGRIEEARALGERTLTMARPDGARQICRATVALAWAERAAGHLQQAAEHLRSVHALLENEDDRALAPLVTAELACVLALAGEYGEAGRLALDARARTRPDFFSAEVLWRRALALVAAGEDRMEEAVRLSHEAWARAVASDWLSFRGQTLEEAAAIRAGAGDDEGAVAALRGALEVYERKGHRPGVERIRAGFR